jgi:DNA-binding LacI/PurR family transcriptional regulator
LSNPTIRDVAQKAGVGIGTVSRVLNNSPLVNVNTRQRVLEAIAELGFRPNSIARQLPRKQRIHNIGVITQPFFSYRSFAERLRGVQEGLNDSEREYELVLYSVSSIPHYQERLASIAQGGSVEALIIIDLELSDGQKEMLRQAKIPFAGINHLQNQDWPCVGANNVYGAQMATTHLVELGHTEIAYIGDNFFDPFGFLTSRERYQGYCEVLNEHHIPIRENYFAVGLHDYDVARNLCRDMLTQASPPTAIFAMSDIQALGCIAACHELGLRVPEDISIIGYDDLEMSYHTNLTTIRQYLELSGRITIEYLIQHLKGGTNPPAPLPLPEVITRRTTGVPRRIAVQAASQN